MATRRFVAQADDVKQVNTFTLGGTPAQNDTVTVTCDHDTVVVTFADIAPTAEQAAAAVVAAINATGLTDNITSVNETRNAGGQSIGVFRDIVASTTSTVGQVKLESRVAGVPFGGYTGTSMAVDVTGSITRSVDMATDTNATGKKWADNANNYEGDAVPVANADTLRLDHGDFDICYGLTGVGTGIQLETTNDWTGSIGLPQRRPDGTSEYLPRFLVLEGDGGGPATVTANHKIGIPTGNTAQGHCYLDFGIAAWASLSCYVHDSAGVSDDGHAVQIVGGLNLNAYVIKGTCSIGAHPQENAVQLVGYSTVFTEERRSDQDAQVLLGSNINGATVMTAFSIQGGITTAQDAKLDGSGLSNNINRGTLRLIGACTLDDVKIYGGGTLECGGFTTLGSFEVFDGGTLDVSRATAACNVSGTKTLHKGSRFFDPLGRVTGGIVFAGTHPGDGDSELIYVAGKTWTPT